MSTLEIFASLFFAISVVLCNFRSVWNYAFGIIGTVLFYFVFKEAGLYFTATLQIYFSFVQLYGLWFWLYGDKGNEPKVTKLKWSHFFLTLLGGVIVAKVFQHSANTVWDAHLMFLDALIFTLSIIAQWFLDRKKLQNWYVWNIVNIISIVVFWQAGLVATTIIYVFFFLNAFWGLYLWTKAFKANAK